MYNKDSQPLIFKAAQPYLQETLNLMKAEGWEFPPIRESGAMFEADVAPEWAEGTVCHRCRTEFGIVTRQHHCRACGQVFCGRCSSKACVLPKFGIEKEVRNGQYHYALLHVLHIAVYMPISVTT